MQIQNPLLEQQESDVLDQLVAGMQRFESRMAQFEQQLEEVSGQVEPRIAAVNAYHDDRLDELRRLLDDPDVEPYQPIYGLTGLLPGEPRRSCIDRCRAIEHYLGQIHDLRLLDIGSSLGYVSFHFAERGAEVTGWESHLKNAEVARQVSRITGIDVDFRTNRFDGESIDEIADSTYDVALLLSVVHHLVDADGLESVQALMADLLGRVPTLILELACKGENPDLYWDAAQPDNELAIFDAVRDNVKIVKIGEFGNHLSHHQRPLYAVSTIANSVSVNGTKYSYQTKSIEAYAGSPMPINRASRRYYFDNDHIVKEYDFAGDHEVVNCTQIVEEINSLTQLADVPGVPELLDHQISADGARIAVRRIPGSLLVDLLETDLDEGAARSIAEQVLRTLTELEAVGLRHNDVRSWNVIYDGEKAALIDFGLVSHLVVDDDAHSLLWLLKAVLTGEREDFDPRQESLPCRELFTSDPGLQQLFLAVDSGERSPAALLRALTEDA